MIYASQMDTDVMMSNDRANIVKGSVNLKLYRIILTKSYNFFNFTETF